MRSTLRRLAHAIDGKDVTVLAGFLVMLTGIAHLSIAWAEIVGGGLPLALCLFSLLRPRS